MTYTAGQLREMAAQVERGHQILGDDEILAIIRAHAAALEELAKAEGEGQVLQAFYNSAMDRAERAEAALAESERKCERLKFHAEAMAETLDKWATIDQCKCSAVDAYRAEFKEE